MSWSVAIQASVGSLTIDVELGSDSTMVLVGPNGSGKTTLLRAIAGAHPASGVISVGGRRLDGLPPEARGVGYVPQGFGLFPHLSVLDNVAFGADGDRARAMLHELGCSELADRSPSGLSGGEQQRVALARALVRRPELLLLDEPLSALDAGSRRSVRNALRQHLDGRRSLVVTHDVRDVAALDAPVVVLEHGRIVQAGSLDDLRTAPATPFVAELVS